MAFDIKNVAAGLLSKASELTQKSNCVLCGKEVVTGISKKLGCGYLCSECNSKYSSAIKMSGIPAKQMTFEALLSIKQKEDKKRKLQLLLSIGAMAVVLIISMSMLHSNSGSNKGEAASSNTVEEEIAVQDPVDDKDEASQQTIDNPSSNLSQDTSSNDYSNSASSDSVSYSSNNKEDAKKGNQGVYAYKGKGNKEYSTYYIIDFDNRYVYYFTDGNGSETCERVSIQSGDLNSYVLITYHDGGDQWSYGLHFKWKNQPDILIVQDEDGFEWEFSTTDLNNALRIRDKKQMIDY